MCYIYGARRQRKIRRRFFDAQVYDKGTPSLSDSFPRDFTHDFMQINIDFSSSVFNLSIFLIEFIFSVKVIRGKGRFVEGES